ncbi:hypothetical protein ACFOUV_11495 [Oceanobacillus longus]|uniref:Uncharacterized protein n=1 Tax=Oceanobacillus longus TaxID=930120 RepID=A0ABV8H211_9BACI
MPNHRQYNFDSEQKEGNNRQKQIEVKTWVHTFSHPDEHKEFMEEFKIASQFEMRYRGLLEFYGADLIAYKRNNMASQHVNEFLHILSKFFTDHLENNCPSSWKECQSTFWEEFISTCYPQYMKLSTKHNESEIFLTQLMKFVKWLDKRIGTTCYKAVKEYAENIASELRSCEQLLNELHLHSFPRLHAGDWNPMEDISRIENELQDCDDTINSIFEVESIAGNLVTLCDIDSTKTYQVTDFPAENVRPGILLEGTIGRKNYAFYWLWYHIEGVYPQIAQKYISFEN